MERARAAYFSPSEQRLIKDTYEEIRHIITQKGNTAAIIKQREAAWQQIADRLNATNTSDQMRTWQQVKVKYKNILQSAVRKKAHASGTGDGAPTDDFMPAEEVALDQIGGRPTIEGGTATDSVPPTEPSLFMQVSGETLTLLEPLEDDPGEGTSASAAQMDAADDEETLSLDSRRFEDTDEKPDNLPGNVNAQTVRQLYATHLKRQIALTDVKLQCEKRRLQDMELDTQLKRKNLRKLELEIKKLEKELQSSDSD